MRNQLGLKSLKIYKLSQKSENLVSREISSWICMLARSKASFLFRLLCDSTPFDEHSLAPLAPIRHVRKIPEETLLQVA